MAVEGESVYDRYGQAKGRSKRFTRIGEGAWAGARAMPQSRRVML